MPSATFPGALNLTTVEAIEKGRVLLRIVIGGVIAPCYRSAYLPEKLKCSGL